MTNLTELRFERSHSDEVDAALSAMDCVLLGDKGVYASSELSSGRRAQRLQREHGASDSATLRDRLGSERYNNLLWSPNVASALAFAHDLRKKLGTAHFIISPAPFTAPGWTQAAYLAFWEKVIRTRVKAVYFNEGWEYSNGCVYEFVVANHAQLPTFDRNGVPISVQEGLRRIANVIGALQADGLDVEVLKSSWTALSRRLG